MEDYNNEAVFARLTQDLLLSVCGAETAPIRVQPAEQKIWEVPVGAKVEIPLQIIRHADFNAGFNLKAAGDAALDPLKEMAIASKMTNAVFTLDLAQAKLAKGTHTFYLQGQTSVTYRNNPEAAQAAQEAANKAQQALADIQKEAKTATRNSVELQEKLKAADARKSAAAEYAKRATERAKPREVTFTIYTPGITVRVIEPAKKQGS